MMPTAATFAGPVPVIVAKSALAKIDTLAAEPRAVQLQKALIQAWEEAPISRAITAGVDAFEDAWTTDEPAHAMARFLAERRAAKGDA